MGDQKKYSSLIIRVILVILAYVLMSIFFKPREIPLKNELKQEQNHDKDNI